MIKDYFMNKTIIMKLILFPLLYGFVYGIGCSATYNIPGNMMPDKNHLLKKRVLVAPVIDQAGVGEKKIEDLTTELITRLKKDPSIIVRTMHESTSLEDDSMKSPQVGIVIDPDWTKKAEEMGMNVFVTAILDPFDITAKKSGFWFFRKTKHEAEISMVVSALDITTHTIILTNRESRKETLPGDVSEEQGIQTGMDNAIRDDALSSLLKDQASRLLHILHVRPWTGRLIFAEDGSLQIKGGTDVGIIKGSVFEVFGQGKPILSASGKNFYPLGSKVGEIKAVRVMQDHSIVVPLSGESFTDDLIIRVK
jgi:hypothetical protein